jgi:hypothetical protein
MVSRATLRDSRWPPQTPSPSPVPTAKRRSGSSAVQPTIPIRCAGSCASAASSSGPCPDRRNSRPPSRAIETETVAGSFHFRVGRADVSAAGTSRERSATRGRQPTARWRLCPDIARRAPRETSSRETTSIVLRVHPESREGPSAEPTRWLAPRTDGSRFLDPSRSIAPR